ncbi:hypothetical protein GCM10007415_29050 [Parapedobacter pyrenivorans]|uniref:Baseplate J-like protein n=1 Tax=Parapedobacter pyrenivorans TaxID=1305674 RepID=A0A917HV97_9SPHI|nr:hypothetical protein [Parapedobacter pyrenivorans]GGG92455.1 hypothetical protein GCM10007415_29050 [Parapedobacter pyrenivorans]
MKDGLSQQQRIARLAALHRFKPVYHAREVLLKQVLAIAGAIRYHNADDIPDGYFDQLLVDLEGLLSVDRGANGIPEGYMEPGQALLYAFLEQLHRLADGFNDRWHGLADWYVSDVLQVDSLPPVADRAVITFQKKGTDVVIVPRATSITDGNAKFNQRIRYRLVEDLTICDVRVHAAYLLYFERHPEVFPANIFEAVTAIRKMNLLENPSASRLMFGTDFYAGRSEQQPIGLQIASPGLLLREGKRNVTLSFVTEKLRLGGFSQLRKVVIVLKSLQATLPFNTPWKEAKLIGLQKVFNQLFYLEISTADGWTAIPNYFFSIGGMDSALALKFELSEQFAATVPCRNDSHGIASEYPMLKILINRDSWLFPYAWLQHLLLTKIVIDARVEGITDILFYNDLGRVDLSAPFAPFGINTSLGAWFTVGNYEMASKNTESLDLSIEWQQLPIIPGGLQSHYAHYGADIDNRSFVIQPSYLADYKWRDTHQRKPLFLFATEDELPSGGPEPAGKLVGESMLRNVNVANMPPIKIDEATYDYGFRSKAGFVNFELKGPDIGFGEHVYRDLFTTSLIKQALRKRRKISVNSPVNPLIKRISLSYTARDEINVLIDPSPQGTALYHVHPFGTKKIYPTLEKAPLPFAYSTPHDANLLFELDGAKSHDEFQFYIEFMPQNREVSREEIPVVTWYWGDSYQWQKLPSGTVLKNTTRNFLTSGMIKFRLPAVPEQGIRDCNGRIWLCAAITQNEHAVSSIKRIVINSVEVQRDPAYFQTALPDGFVLDATEVKHPGIATVEQITPFTGEITQESAQAKLLRVSEYSSHRGRAVTPRDFERMVLQQFPTVRKVKCLPATDVKKNHGRTATTPGVVTLVVVPQTDPAATQPFARCSPELLLDIEEYLGPRVSAYVTRIDAINPICEEVMVRCQVVLFDHAADDNFQLLATNVINHCIAPWRGTDEAPILGYTFTLQQLQDELSVLPQIKDIQQLEVIQLINGDKTRYILKSEVNLQESIAPTRQHAVMVPASYHVVSSTLDRQFGINEMSIDENFVL